ncbi:MAG TPA: ABC transporter ATP-binding protein [Firmicutes bacterium]|nr:ABC transporter ATP-binding protein [Bacillota bacterium]
MTENAIISAENLTKSYPTDVGLFRIFKKAPMVHALRNVSFNVYNEEVFGILGPNGAGKTTLVKILAGLIIQDSGTVNIFGKDTVKKSDFIRNRIGIITGDERGFYWRLTGKENLLFFGTLSNLPPKIIKERIPMLLDIVNLKDAANLMFKEYSSGMKTRLQLARAMLTDPDILLLDEPTKSLDLEGREKFIQLLQNPILNKKPTVILATHSLSEAERLCSRYIILKKGEKVITGDITDIRKFLRLNNHIFLSISSPEHDVVKKVIEKIKAIPALKTIRVESSVPHADINLTYSDNSLSFIQQLLNTFKEEGKCEIVSLNLNSKDLKEIMHMLLELEKVKTDE